MQTSFVPSEVFSWTLSTISLHLADRKWEEGGEMTHWWVNSHGRARFRWTSGGQADSHFSHSPAWRRPELKLRDSLVLAAVACRKLCLAFSVFFCILCCKPQQRRSYPSCSLLSLSKHVLERTKFRQFLFWGKFRTVHPMILWLELSKSLKLLWPVTWILLDSGSDLLCWKVP